MEEKYRLILVGEAYKQGKLTDFTVIGSNKRLDLDEPKRG